MLSHIEELISGDLWWPHKRSISGPKEVVQMDVGVAVEVDVGAVLGAGVEPP